MIRTLNEVINSTRELLIDKFPSKEKYADEIINVILARTLVEFRLDLSKKSWLQIYQEYCLPLDQLDSTDVTRSEIELLISEAKLGERDTVIATLYYIERKSEDIIANELEIDKKTVHNNVPKISNQLKRTALQMYRNTSK